MEQKDIILGKAASTIELNGQQYNARTGALIDGVRPVPHAKVLQDITSRSGANRTAHSSKSIHKSAQPSRTLMRRAVQKPSTVTSRKTVAMDVVAHGPGLAAGAVFHAPNHIRQERAQSISKLPLISRFGNTSTQTVSRVPAQVSDMVRRPVQTSTSVSPPLSVIKPQNTMSSKKDKLLDKGLREADTHTMRLPKKQRLSRRISRKLGFGRRTVSVVSGSLAVLLLGGFFMYQNIPSINVRYAATKSGVHASLPGYQPAGFAVNSHVQYSPGQITIAYKANADNRSYTLSQQNTSWNSDALRDHLATATGSTPQSYPYSGLTIYLHDSSRADWVAGGVWYSIAGDSKLNTDQLIKIATSI